MADFNKIGYLVIRDGRVLLCRKHGLPQLILPGGRIEPGESADACLRRELIEELGDVEPVDVEYVNTYCDRAATADPGEVKTVEIQLFRGELRGTPVASSEIDELVWFGPEDNRAMLSPILIRRIFPDLYSRRILPWSIA